MKKRCYLRTHAHFADYGGRGITVCDEWLDFENFKAWALSHGYADHLEIDRSNNNLGYGPDNCSWTTEVRNQNNKRNNRLLTLLGETKTMKDWPRDARAAVGYGSMKMRAQAGWADADIVLMEKLSRGSKYANLSAMRAA
jgi:hypothetical protein